MTENGKGKSGTAPSKGLLRLGKLLGKLLGVLVLLVVGLVLFTEYVYPYEYGIKQNKWYGGLSEKTLPGGRIYFTVPGVIIIHRFPSDVQSLQMTIEETRESREQGDIRNTPAIEIDTSDGSKVKVDVTLLYHITDAFKVFNTAGPGRNYEERSLIQPTIGLLKKHLGMLLAEDFYNEVKRLEKTEAARRELNTQLADHGLEVDHVLIRQYYYEQGYQKQIEERKVKDQLVFTNQSATLAAKEDARKRKIIAEGEAAVEVERRRGDAEITKIRAEADLYARKQRAEGDLLVATAQAEGTELENNAYEGVGSPNIVAERMAETLNGIEVIVVPSSGTNGVNPLDIDRMVSAFGAR